MRKVHTQIDIDAPVTKVWELITDLEGYAEWNPFVVMGKGPIFITGCVGQTGSGYPQGI